MANYECFSGRIAALSSRVSEYGTAELARELVRLACEVNPSVLSEPEFKVESASASGQKKEGYVTVPVVELSGKALVYAWKVAFGRCNQSVKRNLEMMPTMARYVLAGTLGETADIPAELLQENSA